MGHGTWGMGQDHGKSSNLDQANNSIALYFYDEILLVLSNGITIVYKSHNMIIFYYNVVI